MQVDHVFASAVDDSNEQMEKLSGSARGWHTVQMAVLGFIGICGILRTSDSSLPHWVQIAAGVLAAVSLGVACLAVFTVARVAYPLGGRVDLPRSRGRLRRGIRVTVLALTLIVAAALSGWWPASAEGGPSVAVSDASGHSWCGTLVDETAATISIRTEAGLVGIPTQSITQLRPVTQCSSGESG